MQSESLNEITCGLSGLWSDEDDVPTIVSFRVRRKGIVQFVYRDGACIRTSTLDAPEIEIVAFTHEETGEVISTERIDASLLQWLTLEATTFTSRDDTTCYDYTHVDDNELRELAMGESAYDRMTEQ